ncbi:MAG: hypothetical protein RL722_22 [Pseudomonadota bacterium]|jgi:hypothetical protein
MSDVTPGATPDGTTSAEAGRRRKRLMAWLGLAFSAVVMVLLLAGVNFNQFRQAAAQVPLWAWIAGSAGVLASHALRAARLRAEWRPRTGASLGACLRLALLHNAAVLLLPLRTGEAGYAWWLHRSWGVSLAEALHSLLWLRLQDLAVLGLLAVGLFLPLAWPLALGATLALALILAVALPALIQRLAARLHVDAQHLEPPATDLPPGRAGKAWRTVGRVLGKILQAVAARRSGVSSWVYAITNWSLRLVVVGGLLVALGVMDLPAGLRGALGGELGALMPLQGPAGLGTYEAGVWAGAAWHAGTSSGLRVPVAEVAAAALAVHALWVATGLAAAALAALWTRFVLGGEVRRRPPNP